MFHDSVSQNEKNNTFSFNDLRFGGFTEIRLTYVNM